MKVKIEVSARHIHLCQKDIEFLFGKNYKLKIKRELSQPGQFLSNEKLTIQNKDHFIENVSVLGPAREQTQVEISMTDARKLKINTEIRESGDLVNTPGCILIGPNGKLKINYGVIVAKRHIHVNPNDEIANFFKNGDECNLKIKTKFRRLILGQTVIRISDKFSLAAHIDTDEANAAGVTKETFGEILTL
jgi:putative phosphotransacetylase